MVVSVRLCPCQCSGLGVSVVTVVVVVGSCPALYDAGRVTVVTVTVTGPQAGPGPPSPPGRAVLVQQMNFLRLRQPA
eukprot:1664877-Rhodomonas_salina.1